MAKKIRLEEIAKACGVTPATVSRILNNRPEFSASDELRNRVHEAARSMGYAPDLGARGLVANSMKIVGVFGSPYTHISQGINSSLLDGISALLHEKGYDVFMEISSTRPREHALPFWRFDGAIVLQAPDAKVVSELKNRNVSYVCLNEILGEPVTSVLADDPMGTRLALDHLYKLGHRKIAYANALYYYFKHYSIQERQETLVAWAAEKKVNLVSGYDAPLKNAGEFFSHAVKRNHATAILAYDHQLGIELHALAAAEGIKVPDELSIVCFNDEFPTDLVYPKLTVVEISSRAMGRTAARLLIQTLESPGETLPTQVRLPEKLVVRGSTGKAPK